MQTVTTVGLDIAKSVFQVHGIDGQGNVMIRRHLKRRYVLGFFLSGYFLDFHFLERNCRNTTACAGSG
jgi:hypothetical protein